MFRKFRILDSIIDERKTFGKFFEKIMVYYFVSF